MAKSLDGEQSSRKRKKEKPRSDEEKRIRMEKKRLAQADTTPAWDNKREALKGYLTDAEENAPAQAKHSSKDGKKRKKKHDEVVEEQQKAAKEPSPDLSQSVDPEKERALVKAERKRRKAERKAARRAEKSLKAAESGTEATEAVDEDNELQQPFETVLPLKKRHKKMESSNKVHSAKTRDLEAAEPSTASDVAVSASNDTALPSKPASPRKKKQKRRGQAGGSQEDLERIGTSNAAEPRTLAGAAVDTPIDRLAAPSETASQRKKQKKRREAGSHQESSEKNGAVEATEPSAASHAAIRAPNESATSSQIFPLGKKQKKRLDAGNRDDFPLTPMSEIAGPSAAPDEAFSASNDFGSQSETALPRKKDKKRRQASSQDELPRSGTIDATEPTLSRVEAFGTHSEARAQSETTSPRRKWRKQRDASRPNEAAERGTSEIAQEANNGLEAVANAEVGDENPPNAEGQEDSQSVSTGRASQSKKATRSKIDHLEKIIAETDGQAVMSGLTYAAYKRGARSLKTEDDVISDAANLKPEEMLYERAYAGPHLKILQKHYGLQYRLGAFSTWEQERMIKALEDFMKENEFDYEDVVGLIHERTEEHQHRLYDTMCKNVTRSVPGRPLKFVREWIRRKHPKRQHATGTWTEDQLAKLRDAFRMHNRSWPEVAKAVGRSAEACRTKVREWTEIGAAGNDDQKGAKWSAEEIAALRSAVDEAQQHRASLKPEDRGDLWTRVCTIMASHGYSRRRNSCLTKWQVINRQKVWDADADGKELIMRLSRQKRALERDDFNEVDIDSLCDDDWQWTRGVLRRSWRHILRTNIDKKAAEHSNRNFAENIAKLVAILQRGIFVPAYQSKEQAMRKDVIESDEEEQDELVSRAGSHSVAASRSHSEDA